MSCLSKWAKYRDTELFKSSLMGSKFLFAALVVHTKAKYNEIAENGVELVTPLLPFCFKVPVVSLAYLRPVNLTQPSSREDLGSNKGLTQDWSGLWSRWRRWLQQCQPLASHLHTPSLTLLCLSLSSPSLHLQSSPCVCVCVSVSYLSLPVFTLFRFFDSVSMPLPLSGMTFCEFSLFQECLCVCGYIKAGIVLHLQWFSQKANFPKGKRAHVFLHCVCFKIGKLPLWCSPEDRECR